MAGLTLRLSLLRLWKRSVSAFCFSLFFAGGTILYLTVLPALHLAVRDPVKRQERLLAVISRLQGLFMQLMCVCGIFREFRITGQEPWVNRPCLVIANHPTLLDIVALFSCLPRASCIVKESLRHHPFFGGVVRNAGYLSNGDAVALITRAGELFRNGFSLIVFPEGSRSLPGGFRPFHRGAAHIALECGVPIVPVCIRCEPPFLGKHNHWHQIPDRAVTFTFDFQPEFRIPPEVLACDVPSRRVRLLTDALQNHMEKLYEQR